MPYFESELGYEHFGMLQQAGVNVEKNEIVGFKAPGVELTVDFVGNTYPCAICLRSTDGIECSAAVYSLYK